MSDPTQKDMADIKGPIEPIDAKLLELAKKVFSRESGSNNRADVPALRRGDGLPQSRLFTFSRNNRMNLSTSWGRP